jgi:hypothetical protein
MAARPGVGDGGVDLHAVADDPGIGHEPGHLGVAVARHHLGIEPVEGGEERRPLAEDGEPGQARLEELEAQQAEERVLVAEGPTPLVVVVGDVQGVARAPPAAGAAVVADDEVGAGRGVGHGRGPDVGGGGGCHDPDRNDGV